MDFEIEEVKIDEIGDVKIEEVDVLEETEAPGFGFFCGAGCWGID